MKYVGIDLHKKTIVLCVMNKERQVVQRQKFFCAETDRISEYFRGLGEFSFAVEATGTYEWLANLLSPLAQSWVLVNPSRFEMIAKSAQKTDRHDAHNLAEFLVLGMLPRAYYPPARVREHRLLVRYRVQCRRRVSHLICRIRQVAARCNADRKDLLDSEVMEAFQQRADLSEADRFVLKRLLIEHRHALEYLEEAAAELSRFAKQASPAEKREREILQSAPGVGPIVTDVVLAELGEVSRFPSIKDVSAYAGLVPKLDESGDKAKQLKITKAGSRLLRWGMVQAAWQAVRTSDRWRGVFESIKRRRGAKRAIIAVARRLLGVLVSMLKQGKEYRWSLAELKYREGQQEKRRQRRIMKRQAAATKQATKSEVAPVQEEKPKRTRRTKKETVMA
jgi:transposase